MRLLEFASAEEQLALWKLVSDNVWKAIAQQARDEAAEKAERARQTKLRAKSKLKAAAPLPDPIPALPPPPLPKPKPLYPNKTKATATQAKPSAVQPTVTARPTATDSAKPQPNGVGQA